MKTRFHEFTGEFKDRFVIRNTDAHSGCMQFGQYKSILSERTTPLCLCQALRKGLVGLRTNYLPDRERLKRTAHLRAQTSGRQRSVCLDRLSLDTACRLRVITDVPWSD